MLFIVLEWVSRQEYLTEICTASGDGTSKPVMNRRSALLALTGSAMTARGGSRAAVVVELFTSEGCSSCPPADHLLTQLDRNGSNGVDVIALSEHVDYWNHLGWSDAFSSPMFSTRQQQYASRFQLSSVYTPQVVVNGYAEALGSDRAKVAAAIERAARLPSAAVTVELAGYHPASEFDSARLRITVDGVPPKLRNSRFDIYLVVTESGLVSRVSQGENQGRELTHTGVVRSLTRIAELLPWKSRAYSATLLAPVARGWDRRKTRAVVYLQDRETQVIAGAAACSI